MKKTKKVSGFQMNKKTGHPSYAYSQKRKQVKSVGFTHNQNDKAQTIKLKHNINPNDTRDCFVKVEIEVQKSSEYRKTSAMKELRIHQDDNPTIIKIIRQDKKRDRLLYLFER